MKHFSIYIWKTCAYFGWSISNQIVFWGTLFITGIELITFRCFWYYKKIHILHPKKFSFIFMSHLLFVGYIFQLQHLQAYYKCSLSFIWRRHVSTGNRYVRCGRSHSHLSLKIDTHKKETKSLKNQGFQLRLAISDFHWPLNHKSPQCWQA